MSRNFIILIGLLLLINACQAPPATPEYVNWDSYLGGKETNQYSPLNQITVENVKDLQVAWTYRCGDSDQENRSQIQCNPLIIDGVLYGSTPRLKFFALDAATGKELWKFDPYAGSDFEQFGMGVNRGLAYWTDQENRRLLVTAGSDLYCLDAVTGRPVTSFGQGGKVDLHDGLDRDISGLFISSNTPGIVYRDLLILGARVSESTGHVPGHIRAFNVKTGAVEWIFHTIPHPGEYGYETWPEDAWKRSGGANAWAGFSLDEERGIVFVPTGSASFDFYGGDRHGENLFANALIALDALTGKRIWHFQMVHHDLWDRDLPCPANLVTVTHDGKKIDAVAQVTKSAHVFLFDRQTGQPLFPVEEIPVPPSQLEGEQAWPTQPLPVRPPQFSRGRITEADLTRRTPEAYQYAKSIWDNALKGQAFIPPSERGSFIFPGLDGGGEWGGGAVDPTTAMLYINASEMPWILQMLPYEQKPPKTMMEMGRKIYSTNCQICHGQDRQGMAKATVPSLLGLKDRLDGPAVVQLLKNGRAAMPAFGHLSDEQIEAISTFLLEKTDRPLTEELQADRAEWPYPYFFNGYRRFNDHEGYPAITPPWGTLNAINLNTGEIDWKVPLGHWQGVENNGEPTGLEGYGGPVVTGGGLIFIAATRDEKFRAFNKADGSLLWETKLPAAGFATPATYAINGKQFVVIACGGGKLGRPSGDQYVAFALSTKE